MHRALHVLDASAILFYIPAVLKLLRLEDHLQILSLGRGPPLKIMPWIIAKLVCLCAYIFAK